MFEENLDAILDGSFRGSLVDAMDKELGGELDKLQKFEQEEAKEQRS